MELKIRNVDPSVVKKPDVLAKRSGFSKQVYLKETLESFAMLEVLTNKEKYYAKQFKANTIFLQKASKKFGELEKEPFLMTKDVPLKVDVLNFKIYKLRNLISDF